LIEVSLDPLVTIGSDGRIKDVNAATEAATGYAREQLIGTDFSDYFTDPEKARAGYRQVFRDGEVFDYALDLRHRDGHVISVLYNASVYRDETGRVSGVFAAARDITERKRVAEELQKHREHLEELVEQRTRELRENENKYRTLFESSTDAIMTLDENSFIDCNTATLKMFGCNQKSEFSILHPADISPPNQPDGTDSRAAADLRIAEAFKKGSAQFEWIHRTRNGQDFPAEVLLSAFKLGGKQVLQATVRDITERRRMEEQLRRSEKLAVLGQLAGGVGHELRNPLGAIKNAAYFLNMVLEQPEPEVKETLEILDKEVASCEHIISSLLEFARQKPPAKHRTDIADIIQRTLSHMRVPEKVEVVSQHDRALPLILADPDQLSQVFDNVILNAVQAMPEGGQLVIKYSVPEPGWVAISFTDTGVGMSPEAMKSLFQPLFTTKAKGIGLGLAIVKTLVEGHKGTIEVQSELGEGSTFTVKLPISGG
jgi:PAS domain S-box-containing protein